MVNANARRCGAAHIAAAPGAGVSVSRLRFEDLPVLRWLLADRALFVKIDTEGYEMAVLDRSAPLFARGCVAARVVEIDAAAAHLVRYGTSVQALYARLALYGYAPGGSPPRGRYDETFRRRTARQARPGSPVAAASGAASGGS